MNIDPLASYNFKDLSDYIVYHFEYVKENIIIDNKKIIEELKVLDEIENLNFNIMVNIPKYET